MENSTNTVLEKVRRVIAGWIIPLVLTLGAIILVASFAKGTSAAATPQTNSPTMVPMPGMNQTPTAMPAMPGMAMPTAVPVSTQEQGTSDLDVILQKMQQTMQSLNGMMGQLEQKAVSAPPTATPTAVPSINLQPIMAELQDINRTMLPLMQRIQADLKGSPSADELASVRAQVAQIQTRMTNLINQLQAARNGTTYVAPAPAATALPGMGAMQPTAVAQPNNQTTNPSQMAMSQLDTLMQQMQVMLQQMQTQQMGNKTGQTGGMNMAATPTAMPGMSNPSDPAMSGMMSMMDNMMSMMSGMMGGSGSSTGMNMATATPAPMGGMSNPPAQATPMAGMSTSAPSGMMDNMMKMMDNMMMMMDNMMQMDMMGMPDM